MPAAIGRTAEEPAYSTRLQRWLRYPEGWLLLAMDAPENDRMPQRPVQRARSSVFTPGLIYSTIAGVAIAVVMVCGANAVARLGDSFPGFFLWSNLFVPAVGDSTWTGVNSGLRYHSWLVEADGQSVSDPAEVDAVLANRIPGERVKYRLFKDGEEYILETEVMQLNARAWFSVIGIYTLNAIVLITLAVTVLYMKPRDPAARALFLFSSNLALYMATSVDSFGPYWFRVPYFFFVNFVPVTVWNLLSRFPVGRKRKQWEDSAICAVAGAAVIHALASNWAFNANHELLFQLEAASHGLMALAGLSAVAFYLFHFLAARTRTVRDRTKIVLLGTLGAFTPPIVVLALVYGAGIAFPFNFLTMLFVVFPLSIAYAIAKHDLFDIDRAIKRTLVYATLSALVFGAYTLAINVVDIAFENATPITSRIAEGLLILGLIVATNPSRRRIQDGVDRLYDRRRYEYRDVVRSVAQTFTRILDFEKLIERVLRLLDETMQPTLARVYVLGPSSIPILHGELLHGLGDSTAVRSDPDGLHDPEIGPVFSALVDCDVVTAEDDLTGGHSSHAAAALRACKGTIAVPMRLSGSLTGAIVVGDRRAGGYFTGTDVELLRTLADQLAVALDNARSYRTIDALNQNLGLKNVALEDANRELRETQNELVRKERLAVIGELSGAVAHAIRNPLAGIKAAAQLAMFEIDHEDAADAVRDVISETDRLDERIGALLAFSKPFEPQVRHTALSSIVVDAIRDTRSKAESRAIRVEQHASTDAINVLVDPILFAQAVLELISNALDACPQGGRVHVTLYTEAQDRYACLQVEDDGPGLSTHANDRMFELFFTTKKKGTGFGLATVKRIIEAHGGEIETEKSDLGGALFRVRVPLASAASA